MGHERNPQYRDRVSPFQLETYSVDDVVAFEYEGGSVLLTFGITQSSTPRPSVRLVLSPDRCRVIGVKLAALAAEAESKAIRFGVPV